MFETFRVVAKGPVGLEGFGLEGIIAGFGQAEAVEPVPVEEWWIMEIECVGAMFIPPIEMPMPRPEC